MNTKSTKPVEDQEIDLAALSRKFGDALQNFNSFLFDCIQFVIRNIIIILILLIAGVALGFYLDRTQKTYDHQVIVTPNFGSVDYLYDRIDLIDAKIKERDSVFLHSIGIPDPSRLVKIEIKPINDVYRFVTKNDVYYDVLKLMSEDGEVKKIVEERPTSKNFTYHQISFTTRKRATHQKTVKPLLDYLNNSPYFKQLQKEYVNNVHQKIRANETTIAQIDDILNDFSNKSSEGKSGNLVYYNDNTQLNEVIKFKDKLVTEQGGHRVELVGLDKIIKESSSIINIENNKSVNGKMKLLLPVLFILFFVAVMRFRSFYRTQKIKHTAL